MTEERVAEVFGSVDNNSVSLPTDIAGDKNPYGSSSKKGQALELLSKGTPPSVVATVLGVDKSLISQYIEDDVFNSYLVDARAEAELAARIRDDRLDELEDRAIKQVEGVLAWITKPMEAVAVLKTINGLQRRSQGTAQGIHDQAKDRILVELPKGMVMAKVNIQVNTSNEVVEVDGRAMHTMGTEELLREVEARRVSRTTGILIEQEERETDKLLSFVEEAIEAEVKGNDTRPEISSTEEAAGS